MSGVGFLDSTGKSITISDPNNHPHDVSYFTFRSSLNPTTVDQRAPHTVYQFEYSLRLPHNSPPSSANTSLPRTSLVTDKSSETTFNATLSSLSYDKLDTMSATALRLILSTQRDSISATATSKNFTFFDIFHPGFLDNDSDNNINPENGYGPITFFCQLNLQQTT